MTLEEKAGLLFHHMITPDVGVPLTEAPSSFTGEAAPAERVTGPLLNHFNVTQMPDAPGDMARWYNHLQEVAISTRMGVPVTLSSDPRHHFTNNPAIGWRGGPFSQWPEPLGFAAIGEEALVGRFADIARGEYLATGIRVALHPQADLATEPRWARASGTFGEDAGVAGQMVAAYVRGFQGPKLDRASVATMVKHFPGGGAQLNGEDPHFAYGREQVYPGGMFEYHLGPFEAALSAGASQVMPYYGVPMGTEFEEVGFGFNKGVITGLLREQYGFDGIVCTDWGLVTDAVVFGSPLPARAWGVEHLGAQDRVLKIFEAGADQLGGEERPELVIELVKAGRLSEARLDVSARRLLREKFVLGLFDHPLIDEEAAEGSVGAPSARAEGVAAQRSALTLLKNGRLGDQPVLPIRISGPVFVRGIDPMVARQYATLTDNPTGAALAIVRLEAPYEPRLNGLERAFHAGDLSYPAEELRDICFLLGTAPTVVVVHLDRPAVLTEICADVAALVGDFGACDRAVLDVLFGKDEPRGRLPFDLPSSMDEVRRQRPDVPHDMPNALFRTGHGLRYGQG